MGMVIASGHVRSQGVGLGTPHGTARWARLASMALRLAAAAPLLMVAATFAWGLDADAGTGYFVVTGTVALGASFLVRRARAWVRVAGVVLGLLSGAAMFWTAFGLATPDSFFDFVPGVVVLPGALTGAVAGVAAVRAQRRDDTVVTTEGGERWGVRAALGLVGSLVVASAILKVTGRETVGDDVAVDTEVVLGNFEFEADRYVLAPGSTVLVHNDDPFHHTFTVDDLGIDVDLGPGSDRLVTLPVDAEAGAYVLYCKPHTGSPDDPGADDMAADLEIG